ncbi:MAG: TetR/AcrR family transcriptional regulator [Hyphomonadaceae bacterium]
MASKTRRADPAQADTLVNPKRKTRKKMPSRENWVDRTDWIVAGQALLCEEGIAGMRLMKLTERLKVSTGSFYYHFRDMDDFLGALADYYNEDQVADLIDRTVHDASDPETRLVQLRKSSIQSGLYQLDMAMRVWSASDARAQKAMSGAEAHVLDFIRRAFEDAGFETNDARWRAAALLSVSNFRFASLSSAEHRNLSGETMRRLLSNNPQFADNAAPGQGANAPTAPQAPPTAAHAQRIQELEVENKRLRDLLVQAMLDASRLREKD